MTHPTDIANQAFANWQKLWNLHDACTDPDRSGECQNCGESEFSPNAEAFEVTGRLLCSLCAEDALAEREEAEDLRRANPLEPDFRRL